MPSPVDALAARARVWLARHRQQTAYALGGFASAILNTLFKLFNVALFTSVVGIHPGSFYLGHLVYGLWNAVNDPAFGFLLDRMGGMRLKVIQYGGPAWCATFMVTWYPWSYDGGSWLAFLHFLTSMFCFDGFLTLVLMVKCALLADLCVDSKQCNELNNFSAWASLAGSGLAMTSYYVWDPNNLTVFRALAAALSAVSAAAWWFSGKQMVMPSRSEDERQRLVAAGSGAQAQTGDDDGGVSGGVSGVSSDGVDFLIEDIEGGGKHENTNLNRAIAHDAQGGNRASAAGVEAEQAAEGTTIRRELAAWWAFAKQLLSQKHFTLYVSLNWMMNFNVYMSDSFLVFLDRLLMRHVMPVWYRVLVSALCLYLPRFGVQILTPFADRHGLHRMVSMVIKTSLATGVLALVVGRSAWWLWGALLVIQRFALSSWGFYDLIMADVIDADRVKHRRPASVSTSVHGVHSLIVKPAQSIAPMVGVWLLARNGLESRHVGGAEAPAGVAGSSMTSEALQSTIFYLTFGVPLICTLLQFFIWQRFDLKGDKLKAVKDALKNM